MLRTTDTKNPLARLRLSVLSCLPLVALAACTSPSEPRSLSGTVRVPAGEDVQGTLVIACHPKGDGCDEERSRSVQITSSGSEASFTIDGLHEDESRLRAWKDINGNGKEDPGDLSANLELDESEPGAKGLSLTMASVPDDGGTVPPSGTLRGSVTAPPGQDAEKTIVVACHLTDQGCDEVKSQIIQVTGGGPSVPYELNGLEAGGYVLVGWRDVNQNETIDEGDLFGAYSSGGGDPYTAVRPPSVGLAIPMLPLKSQPAAGGTAPSEVVGQWSHGSSTGVDYYNPSNGSWAPPSGTGALLSIAADGSFHFSTMVQSSFYSCTIDAVNFHEGKAAFEGDSLTLYPESSRQKYESSCNPGLNYDHAIPNQPIPFRWRIDGSSGAPRLVLTWPSGEDSWYDRN
jgi:uncharacterized protein (DUF2141 family)